jgi:hypothetical protein
MTKNSLATESAISDRSDFTPHPKNNPITHSYDVALIHVSPPFPLNENINYVALPKASDNRFLRDEDGRTVWVTGFGVTVGG